MKPLRTEDLIHKLKIRRSSPARDGKGGRSLTWATIAEPWAEVIGLDGRESVMDHVLQGVSVYRVRIRWRAGILNGDQIQHGTLELNITSAVDPDGKREQLVIMANTGAALKTS